MAVVYAVTNQKGGSGKTTTAVNLAATLVEAGKKVLVIDLDPQANATTHLGFRPEEVEAEGKTIYHSLISGLPLQDVMASFAHSENLKLVASSLRMAVGETQLFSAVAREGLLKRLLQPTLDKFDYVFLDCPPSLGVLTLNALTAAHQAILTVQSQFFALDGLDRLLDILQTVRGELNKGLKTKVLLTMYDQRNRICRDVEEQVKQVFPEDLFTTRIRTNVRLQEAPSHGKPINIYAGQSPGASDYRALAKEVLENGRH